MFEARRGTIGDVDEQLKFTRPAEWWRVLLVSALADARTGNLDHARELHESAERELLGLGFGGFESLGEGRAAEELQQLLAIGGGGAGGSRRPATSLPEPSTPLTRGEAVASGSSAGRWSSRTGPVSSRCRLATRNGSSAWSSPTEAWRRSTSWPRRCGPVTTSRRAGPGCATCCCVCGGASAMWSPGSGPAFASLQASGATRTSSNVLASDALASARSDPEIAGQLAERALALVDGAVLGDFEYEEWAQASRRSVDQQLIGLLDLLSVQAEDEATCRGPRRSPSEPCGSTATRTRATSGSPSC